MQQMPQASTPPSVGAITHDFGDLGGLGNGAVAGAGAMNGHAAGASAAATQAAIDNLHNKPPPGLGAGAAAAAAPAPAMGVHEEYLAQQEVLRQQRVQLDAQWQQQQQLQQQRQQQAAATAAAATSGASGGGGGGDGSDGSRPAFDSVEELLAKAGQLHLLPNFLSQEFDVNAIALMQQQDFAEIGVSWDMLQKLFPAKNHRRHVRHVSACLFVCAAFFCSCLSAIALSHGQPTSLFGTAAAFNAPTLCNELLSRRSCSGLPCARPPARSCAFPPRSIRSSR